MKEKSVKRKYWYKTVTYECVYCGHVHSERERVYEDEEPRPDDYYKRNEYEQMVHESHFI